MSHQDSWGYAAGHGASYPKASTRDRDDDRTKMSVKQVTQRILSRLMVEGGLTLSDLVKGVAPEATRETVLSVLEVLQVMGVVAHVAVKPGVILADDGSLVDSTPPPVALDESTAAAASSAPELTLYFISSLARAPEALDLCLLKQATANKRASAARVRERCEMLQALTAREHITRQERLQELRALLAKVNLQEPMLKDDLLYRTITELASSASSGGGRR